MKKILSTVLILAFAATIHAEDSKNSWSSPGIPKDPGKFWNPPVGEPPKLTGASPLPAPPEIQNKQDWTLSDWKQAPQRAKHGTLRKQDMQK